MLNTDLNTENLAEEFAANKYLVIEVPTNRNLKDPNKGDWDGHYHYFSKESMRYLFKEKFEIIKTITPGIQSPALLVFLKKLNK